MIRRMGRPGLIGTMARTAVIAGTATAVVGGVSAHQRAGQQQQAAAQATQQQAADSQAEIAAMQQQVADLQAQQANAAPAASAPASGEDDMLTKLAKLGQMKDAGLIDDSEFSAAKAQLLGI